MMGLLPCGPPTLTLQPPPTNPPPTHEPVSSSARPTPHNQPQAPQTPKTQISLASREAEGQQDLPRPPETPTSRLPKRRSGSCARPNSLKDGPPCPLNLPDDTFPVQTLPSAGRPLLVALAKRKRRSHSPPNPKRRSQMLRGCPRFPPRHPTRHLMPPTTPNAPTGLLAASPAIAPNRDTP